MYLPPQLVALFAVLGLAYPRAAAADPRPARVVTAPTAWLPGAGAIAGSAGTLHGADQIAGVALVNVSLGLGELASVDLGTDTDVRGCVEGCAHPQGVWLGRAAFRLGARQDAWFAGMPALVVGVRTTYAARGHEFGRARVTDAYVVGSRALGPFRIHGGVAAIAAGHGAQVELRPKLRPIGGLEWTPGLYPRTSVIADVMWVPRLAPTAITLEWVAGWGVRYQAFSWGSIDLAVRHREDEGLNDSTVMVRVNGVLARRGR